MDTSDLPILYSFRRCPYAMRARLALASSQQMCALREIVLRDKPGDFLLTSPTATVPSLKTPEGKVIDESLDIMIWTLSHHDPEYWLQPGSGSFEDMLSLIDKADGGFKTALDRYKYTTRYDNVDGIEQRTKAASFLRGLNKQLENSTYLFGLRPTLADMAIAPFVRQFANVDRDWFEAENWPHLLRWLNDFLNSERFTSIMTKYLKWQPGDPVTRFPAL
jgi:glutathione S-transferase